MKNLTEIHNDQTQDKQGQPTPGELAEIQSRPIWATAEDMQEFMDKCSDVENWWFE